ncbi:hypothetical protein C8J57DRAFT_1238163 [Mycena rebaudengoi]|nr:hypothetical protein C8J57DRAFT_1238163 [Mycena rebaudengoi]
MHCESSRRSRREKASYKRAGNATHNPGRERAGSHVLSKTEREGLQPPISSHGPRVSLAAAAVSVPSRAVVETPSARPASGLHTPAASDDFNGKTPGSSDKVREFEQRIRSEAGCAQIQPLVTLAEHRSNLHRRSPQQLQMSQEIADQLEEIFSKEREFRLEYLPQIGMMIVTYPTNLHESLTTVMNAFTHIAD